jgi:hypothetical protein
MPGRGNGQEFSEAFDNAHEQGGEKGAQVHALHPYPARAGCPIRHRAFSSQVEHLATRKMRPNKRIIFKPSGTLGDSENATKRTWMLAPGHGQCPGPGELSSGVFSSQVEHLAARKIRPD